jgi:hypothetical protein
MFNYIFSAYQSLERLFGFGDYSEYIDENDKDYIEGNKIILDISKDTIPIVSPIKVEANLITSEHTFVAKY